MRKSKKDPRILQHLPYLSERYLEKPAKQFHMYSFLKNGIESVIGYIHDIHTWTNWYKYLINGASKIEAEKERKEITDFILDENLKHSKRIYDKLKSKGYVKYTGILLDSIKSTKDGYIFSITFKDKKETKKKIKLKTTELYKIFEIGFIDELLWKRDNFECFYAKKVLLQLGFTQKEMDEFYTSMRAMDQDKLHRKIKKEKKAK